MGQIANRTAAELLFRLKTKLRGNKEIKKPAKSQNAKGDK